MGRPITPKRFGPVLPPFTMSAPSSAVIAWQDLQRLKSASPAAGSVANADAARAAAPPSRLPTRSATLPICCSRARAPPGGAAEVTDEASAKRKAKLEEGEELLWQQVSRARPANGAAARDDEEDDLD